MQHIPSVPTTSEHPDRDWLPGVAYLLMVVLLLAIVGVLAWPSLTPATATRDTAYVNPELRLVEQFRAEEASLFAQAAELAINPELKVLSTFRAQPREAQDFAHANPEVGLFQRLQEIDR